MNKITAKEGEWFIGSTNQPTKTIYLGKNDKAENYRTITDEAAQEILKALEEVMEDVEDGEME